MNKVVLKLNGQNFSHWEKVNITSSLNELARSFSLDVTYLMPQKNALHDLFKPSDKVQIFIDDDLILTGYIDKTPINYSATAINVQIVGRSKTADLIDCNPYPEGEVIEFSKDWVVQAPKDGYTEFTPAAVTSRAKRDDKLGNVIATLAGAYDIRFKAKNDDELLSKLNAVKDVSLSPEKTLYDIIASVVICDDLIITDDENGDLVALKKGAETSDDVLELGVNVLSGKADFDASKLYQTYSCAGHAKGNDETSGRDLQLLARSTDSNVSRRRYKFLNNVAENGNVKNNAQSERDYQHAQFYKVTYSVVGWRQSTGKLWGVNQLVSVIDKMLGFDKKTMLIQKVTFDLDNSSGMITTLELIPPEGFKTEPKTAETKNTPSSKNKFSQVKDNDLHLEKNRFSL